MTDSKNISWPGWETVGIIGRGSFGTVYEIERNVFGDVEKAALKVISIPQHESDIDEMYSDGYDDESITSTFQNHLKSIVAEYSLMKKMNDSLNVVHSDDIRYIQHENGFGWDIFIKMELLTPLTKALPADIPEETVVKLAKDMCAALELCRKHGVVHRDIKPQNIFLSPNGNYKLGDFGIAKTVEKTMGGTKIGTYKYMAPEVYNNQPYGMGADIYSLGLVLYWMLNERRMPFLPLPPEKLSSGMEERARNRRFSGEPLPAPAHGSADLKKIVLKACAFDPKERYQTAQEMWNALNQISTQDSKQAAKPADSFEEIEEEKTMRAPVSHVPVGQPTDEDVTVTVKQGTQSKEKETQKRFREEKRLAGNKKWIVAVALVVVCVICGLLFFTGGEGKNNTSVSQQQNATESALIPDENVMSNTIATVELDLLSCANSISLDYDVSNQTCAVINGNAVYGFSEAYVEIDIVNDYGTTYSFAPTDYIIRWDGSRVSIEPNGLPYGVYRITLRNSADQSEYAKFAFSYGFAGEVYLVDHKVKWERGTLQSAFSQSYLLKENDDLKSTPNSIRATVFSEDNPISTTAIGFRDNPNAALVNASGVDFTLRQHRVHGAGVYLYTLENREYYLCSDVSGDLTVSEELDETCIWELDLGLWELD